MNELLWFLNCLFLIGNGVYALRSYHKGDYKYAMLSTFVLGWMLGITLVIIMEKL